MDKLKAQVGPPRRYFKVGFSHIFGGPTSGGNSARMAAANGLSVGFIIALQTHDTNSTTAAVAVKDLRLYQWRLDGVTRKGKNTGTSTNPAYPARDYLCVTPSRYATALQSSYKSQAQTTAGQIKTIMGNYTGAADVILQVQSSNDSATWSALATLPTGASSWTTAQGATVTDTNGQVTVLDGTTTPSNGRRFLRLQVTQSP